MLGTCFRGGYPVCGSVKICNSTPAVATRCEPARRRSDPLSGRSRSGRCRSRGGSFITPHLTHRRTSDVGHLVHSYPQIHSGARTRNHAGGPPHHALAMGPRWPSAASRTVRAKHRRLGFHSDRRVACCARGGGEGRQHVTGPVADPRRRELRGRQVNTATRKAGSISKTAQQSVGHLVEWSAQSVSPPASW